MTHTNALKALEEHAQFHKALAEPVRLRILALLNIRDSLCVCDLVSVLDLSQSTVSRHLAYLKNQSIVDSWREGTWIHYALNKKHPNTEILQATLDVIAQLKQVKSDHLALEAYESSPRQCSV